MELLSRGGEIGVISSVVPLLKFICLSVFGLILSNPKIDLIPKPTMKLLSKLVFALFLPCLIFTNLGPSITLSNLIQWWFVPLNVLLSTAAGFLLGLAVAVLCRPPPHLFRFTVITTAFGNTGNLALAVVTSVCHTPGNPFSGPTCHSSGVAYVALSQWAAVLLVYTLVYHMMEPPLEYYDLVEPDRTLEVRAAADLGRPLLVEAEWPGMEESETEHCKTPLIARVFSGGDIISEEVLVSSHGQIESIRCLAEPRIVRRMRIVAERTPIRHVLQPPSLASLLAIAIGVFPGFKRFVFDEDSVFSIVTDSLKILAEAMVPSAMLVLGGMMAEGPDRSGLGTRTTVGIVVARLLVLPLIGVGIVSSADRLGWLGAGDKLFRFVLLLQYTTPSAILLAAVASLRGYAVKEASAVLFWQHVFAVLSFSFYVVVYFNILL